VGDFTIAIVSNKDLKAGSDRRVLPQLNQEEYRRTEARLDEALAIFAEREAQFSTLINQVRDNLVKVRADVATLRAEHAKFAGVSSTPWL
jgi:predicted  nucleic acid-binding Zn-ribbon protein